MADHRQHLNCGLEATPAAPSTPLTAAEVYDWLNDFMQQPSVVEVIDKLRPVDEALRKYDGAIQGYDFDPIREAEEFGRAFASGVAEGMRSGYGSLVVNRLKHIVLSQEGRRRLKRTGRKLLVAERVQQLARRKGKV